MSQDPDKEAFEEAILANRYDRPTRLLFSDWLEEHGYVDEAVIQRSWTPEKQQAEDWLAEHARTHGWTYVELISSAIQYLDGRISLDLEFCAGRDFWSQFSIATGIKTEGMHDVVEYELSKLPAPCDLCNEQRYDRDEFDELYDERGW
jgi:uncharacterized protein (TIGR02996 family)